MDAIERDNTSLKGVLPKVFALPGLDKRNLGQLIDLLKHAEVRRIVAVDICQRREVQECRWWHGGEHGV